MKVLRQANQVDGKETEEIKEFKKVTKDLNDFAGKTNKMLDKFVKADQHWFFGSFLKLFK